MQGAKCAISKLMYGLSVCTDDNHSLKLVAYRLVHTDEPYISLHVADFIFYNVDIALTYRNWLYIQMVTTNTCKKFLLLHVGNDI